MKFFIKALSENKIYIPLCNGIFAHLPIKQEGEMEKSCRAFVCLVRSAGGK